MKRGNNMIITSSIFAKKKHEGQTRIGGEPYYTHPLAVASILEQKGITDPRYIITALFHDLFEDTDATEEEILYYGGVEVLEAVKLLTKTKGYNMIAYIQAISENPIAKMVKLADRLHNLQSAVVADSLFRQRYIEETENYYIALAKGTPFEEDIHDAVEALKKIA